MNLNIIKLYLNCLLDIINNDPEWKHEREKSWGARRIIHILLDNLDEENIKGSIIRYLGDNLERIDFKTETQRLIIKDEEERKKNEDNDKGR